MGTQTLEQILRRPQIKYSDLPLKNESLDEEVIKQVEIEIKYAGYIVRIEDEVERFQSLETKQIPVGFDYLKVPSLRMEARQKLTKIRPATIGQAARISGVSPADISILLVWLKKGAETNIQESGIIDEDESEAAKEDSEE